MNRAPWSDLSQPPSRQLRLLANLAPTATVVFALLTASVVVGTLHNLTQPMSPTVAFSLVVGALVAGLGCLTTYRFAVVVSRVVVQWEAAVGERTRIIRDQ